MPHSQSQRHLLIVHLFRSYTLVFEFPLRARPLNWVYDLWKGLFKHKAQVTKQFEWKFLCGDHYKLMCGIRTLSWVWKSKASSSASYFDIRGMRVNMCFKHKTYNIYETVQIHERSLSYFRAALFCLCFKTSPGAQPSTRKGVWIARQTMNFKGTLISIWKVVNQDLFWNRGTEEQEQLQNDSLVKNYFCSLFRAKIRYSWIGSAEWSTR